MLKTDLRGQTYKKTRSIKDFSFLNHENTDSFVDRSIEELSREDRLMVMTTDQLL